MVCCQPSTQDLVLPFEEANTSGQFLVGRFGDDEQKGGVDVSESRDGLKSD